MSSLCNPHICKNQKTLSFVLGAGQNLCGNLDRSQPHARPPRHSDWYCGSLRTGEGSPSPLPSLLGDPSKPPPGRVLSLVQPTQLRGLAKAAEKPENLLLGFYLLQEGCMKLYVRQESVAASGKPIAKLIFVLFLPKSTFLAL